MNELIYKPEDKVDRPNPEFEADLKLLETFVEVGENNEDLKNINYLKEKLYSKKFDKADLALITQFKDRYLKKPNNADPKI